MIQGEYGVFSAVQLGADRKRPRAVLQFAYRG